MHRYCSSSGCRLLLEQSALRPRPRRHIRRTRQRRCAPGDAPSRRLLKRLLGQAHELQREPQVVPTTHDPHFPRKLRAPGAGAVGLPRRECRAARSGDGDRGLALPSSGVPRA